MANEEQIEILKKGPVAWNAWRRKHRKVVPDLSNADFHGFTFDDTYLKSKSIAFDFQKSNLSHSKFYDVSFTGVDLSNSDLSHSNFVNAKFYACNFINANCREASVGGATFHGGCDLRGADFSGCSADYTDFADSWLDRVVFDNSYFSGTIFSCNDLSTTRGLETIEPDMPCVIGLETIFLSKGKISESFLRACGAPDDFIAYIPSLIGAMDGIQFYSCFISYSSKDDAFARRLHSRMRDEHLRVWFAPEDLKGGRKTHEQIEEAIRVFDKLLVVLSDNSLQSEWVMTEIRRARKRERETGKRKLFPIRLVDFDTLRDWRCFDSDTGQDLAIEVREYHIPDFSDWKNHDKFEIAFARLLSDLKSEAHGSKMSL
jgi:hypothetical protein